MKNRVPKIPAATCVLLLAAFLAPRAHAADEIATCSPMPSFLRFAQPLYPPNVESRGLPSPVSMIVEFTVSPEGRASEARVIEIDAGTYAREFNEQAIQAVATWQFHRVPKKCRGRVKVIFKIAD